MQLGKHALLDLNLVWGHALRSRCVERDVVLSKFLFDETKLSKITNIVTLAYKVGKQLRFRFVSENTILCFSPLRGG